VDKAYEFLTNKKGKEVIVAVLDSGIDLEHEDLNENAWNNPKEKPNNKKDDDNNGYVDDVNGWNFIGSQDGEHVDHDTFELTRQYKKYNSKFENTKVSELSKKERKEYEYFQELKKEFEETVEEFKQNYISYKSFQVGMQKALDLMKVYLETEEVTLEKLQKVESKDEKITSAVGLLQYAFENNIKVEDLDEGIEYFEDGLQYGYNVDFKPREIVGDNYENKQEKFYGNNDVKGPDSKHGTHVAGIIAANRNNELGMQGIADNVLIMPIRTVPNGDERDKDVANAIYYAVDNGAHIINMSFGKDYSPSKDVVDKAVKYAEKNGVLLIHAAGNDSKDIDVEPNFPSAFLGKKEKRSPIWLEVGASSWGETDNFVGDFSNFGIKKVDLFAPGVDIFSTTPEGEYESLNGTSMAAPVTSGVAALVMSYYPGLSAKEVKEILMESTLKYDLDIKKPGELAGNVNFKKLSRSGGIVNAYEALKLAEARSLKIRKISK